jgi:hypothetical protein
MATEPSWTFFRAGGVDQVVLRDGNDVANLRQLDQKLWVALACPVKGTEIDHETLALIDADDDDRVRAPEVLDAIDWCKKVFKNLDVLMEGKDEVALASFDAKSEEGKRVLASAKRILEDREKKDAKTIGLADVQAMTDLFEKMRFNGDGVVPAESAEDEETKKAIVDVIAAVGSTPDRSGLPGLDKALLEKFFEAAEAIVKWDDEGGGEGIRVAGAETGAAFDALAAVEEKIVDYFTRCKIAGYDARGAATLGPSEADLTGLATHALSSVDGDVARLPIARIEAGKPLSLDAGLNPAWAPRIATFARSTVAPMLGARQTLNEADFQSLVSKLGAYRAWHEKKPAGEVGSVGVARLRELVRSDFKAKILSLIDSDLALAAEYTEIAAVEKAIRFHRDLVRFLRNFVNFSDFYHRKGASFQAGTLYLDARTCDLTVLVADAPKHAALAAMSKAYLAYCECTRIGEEKIGIVAALTAGGVDNVMVGRNGLFYDRKGRDWDATITSIVENPISVREAFWSPYKKLVRTVEEMVAKRAADKEKESSASMDAAAASTASHAAPPTTPVAPVAAPPAAPAAPPRKIDVGTVAAIGVAVGGIGAFLATVFGTFFGLGFWMPIGVAAIFLAISGPSMMIAWLKLRQRNMGPILDANGWAINSMVKINVPFGGSLTKLAVLPHGSSRALDDPYAEKTRPWGLYVFLVLLLGALVLWVTGKADGILPEKVRFGTVVKAADAAKPAPSVAPAVSPTVAPAK